MAPSLTLEYDRPAGSNELTPQQQRRDQHTGLSGLFFNELVEVRNILIPEIKFGQRLYHLLGAVNCWRSTLPTYWGHSGLQPRNRTEIHCCMGGKQGGISVNLCREDSADWDRSGIPSNNSEL